ncbi:MAG: nuclear transport factor 2 family protein [bacterium]|nr:nuclear transport factor 2 family protein [bacterium]
MRLSSAPLTALCLLLMLISACTRTPEVAVDAEKARITQVVKDSIGWALDKDTELLYSCFADDENLFWFTPEATGTTHGIAEFRQTVDNVFLNDAFKAVRFEVREMKVNLSRSRDVAWYSCRLDDENEWDGRPASWLDVRWTGVLEKREGDWVIVQMHFSYGAGQDQG